MKQAVPSSRFLVFFALVVIGCALDLATKSWMFNHLGAPPQSEPWWLWPGVFGFQTNLNGGALFGMGDGWWPLFAGVSVVAAVGICLYLFVAGGARDRLLNVALGLVTAGICGNLYDRLCLHGLRWPEGLFNHQAGTPAHAVRDFIHVMIGSWPWPTFNVADSLLVCGAILLMWHAFTTKPEANTSA